MLELISLVPSTVRSSGSEKTDAASTNILGVNTPEGAEALFSLILDPTFEPDPTEKEDIALDLESEVERATNLLATERPIATDTVIGPTMAALAAPPPPIAGTAAVEGSLIQAKQERATPPIAITPATPPLKSPSSPSANPDKALAPEPSARLTDTGKATPEFTKTTVAQLTDTSLNAPGAQIRAEATPMTPVLGSSPTVTINSPAPAPAPAPVAPPTTAFPTPTEQLVASIRAGVGTNSIEVRMDPPSVGHVRIDFDFSSDGPIRAVVSAESPDALSLLRRNAPTLIRELSDAGLTDLDLAFEQQKPGSEADQQKEKWVPLHAPSPEFDALDAEPAIAVPHYPLAQSAERLNLVL